MVIGGYYDANYVQDFPEAFPETTTTYPEESTVSESVSQVSTTYLVDETTAYPEEPTTYLVDETTTYPEEPTTTYSFERTTYVENYLDDVELISLDSDYPVPPCLMRLNNFPVGLFGASGSVGDGNLTK